MSERGYNGWTNYATWCVHLWLDNDGGLQRFWHETAAECYNTCHGKDNAWDNAINMIAERLKHEIEVFQHPYHGRFLANPLEADMFCDLLDSALSEVNYREIAESFLDDLEESGYIRERYADESEA